jgi:hypothetical protein
MSESRHGSSPRASARRSASALLLVEPKGPARGRREHALRSVGYRLAATESYSMMARVLEFYRPDAVVLSVPLPDMRARELDTRLGLLDGCPLLLLVDETGGALEPPPDDGRQAGAPHLQLPRACGRRLLATGVATLLSEAARGIR